MKTSTAIVITSFVFAGSLWLYFTADRGTPPEAGEAEVISAVYEAPTPAPEAVSESQNGVTVGSTAGINEEYNSFLEGYAAIEDDFNSLDSQGTATTSQ